MSPETSETLKDMKSKIAEIEKLTLELRDLGEGVPVIDKNTRNILGIVCILKFGISDIAEIEVT